MVPEALIGHLQSIAPGRVVLNGELNINPSFSGEVYQPTPLGRIQLGRDATVPPPGLKVKLLKAPALLIPHPDNMCDVLVDNALRFVPIAEVTPLPTRYLVFSVGGIISPFGGDFFSSGIGRAIIYDPFSNTVRGPSLKECWLMHGGNLEEFSVTPRMLLSRECFRYPFSFTTLHGRSFGRPVVNLLFRPLTGR